MDDALVQKFGGMLDDENWVLILVVMDDALVQT